MAELSTLGSVIKTAYEGQPFTRAFGSGLASGNVINKTLAPTGGDFATLDELFTYINNNTFNNVDLRVTASPGSYTAGAAGAGGQYYVTNASGLVRLEIVGTNVDTCIINFSGAETLFWVRGGIYFKISTLTLNNVDDGTDAIAVYADTGSYPYVTSCKVNDFYSTLYSWGSGGRVANTVMDNQNYSGAEFVYAYESKISVFNSTINDESGNAYGIEADGMSDIRVFGTCSITGCDTAFYRANGSRILVPSSPTLSGNGSDYNDTLNKIQYDGGYISNGTAALSFET